MPRRRIEGQAALLDAALGVFVRRGYEAATLEEIGAALGVSRSAVLYHFPNKAALLASVVEPLFDDLEQVFEGVDPDPPLPRGQLRTVVAKTVDAVLAHRTRTTLLAQDLSARTVGGVGARLAKWNDRFVRLTAGDQAPPLATLRSLAALGALTRPPLELGPSGADDPAVRKLFIDITLGVLRTKAPDKGA